MWEAPSDLGHWKRLANNDPTQIARVDNARLLKDIAYVDVPYFLVAFFSCHHKRSFLRNLLLWR